MSNSEKPTIDRSLTAKNIFPRGGAIRGIVLHDTAGSGTHNDTRYLANPGDGRKVSVDFTVERDGSIHQLNPDLKKYCCAHAGRNTNFKGNRNAAVNHVTIGIEIVQKADLSLLPLYPAAQVKAVADLCAWLVKEFALGKDDITTHRQIITDHSRSDPRKFPFESGSTIGFWEYFHRAQGNVVLPSPCLQHDAHDAPPISKPEPVVIRSEANSPSAATIKQEAPLDPPKPDPASNLLPPVESVTTSGYIALPQFAQAQTAGEAQNLKPSTMTIGMVVFKMLIGIVATAEAIITKNWYWFVVIVVAITLAALLYNEGKKRAHEREGV